MADDGSTRVPVASGKPYRVTSPPENALVTRDLASELGKVLDRFAAEAGFNERKPVSVFLKPGVVGHHKVGRAADIYAVGGIGIDGWKKYWDQGLQQAFGAMDPEQRRRNAGAERNRNLGWRLYKALQMYGRWAHPYGYPIQLFGPWTRTEGPWQYISDRLLHAHGDHIHVAKEARVLEVLMTRNFQNPRPFLGHAPADGRGLAFLVAIRRNVISPVSHQNDLLQRMGMMLMTPDEAAVYPPGRAVGPLPPMPAPQPSTSLTAGDRRFLPRPVHGEILRDTSGKLYEKIGQSVRPIHNLAIGPKGEIVEFAPSPRAGAISSTPHVRPPTEESDKARREGWSQTAYEQKPTSEYAPPPMAPQRPTARPTRTPFRMLFPNPGQWRIVQWQDFKQMLAPQLAHPERLNDPRQILCYVQVYETTTTQPLAALARAVIGESGTANDFRPLSAAIAIKLQLKLPPVMRRCDAGPAPRKPGLLPPHERVFRLQVALDPTIDMDPNKPLQSAPEKTPTPVSGGKRTIPDHFLNPLEFKISRDEATYEMNIAPGLQGSWLSFVKRIKHRVSDLAFRKWKALLCGKELEEQLWAVSPPKHGLTHPVIREWALQTLQTAGYDTSVMLAEWELFWRRKGL